MLKTSATLFALWFVTSTMSQTVIKMEISSLPDYHPGGSDVYAAGSFNGWNPQDPAYRFQKDAQGNYFLNLRLEKGSYEYKLTRGGWDKSECKKGGAGAPNRSLKAEEDATVSLQVEDWADRFPATPRVSTAGKNVHIIDTNFLIPQLKRTRRVWVYLPDNYKTTRHPVLYMHDGQNVFDDATSYSGEWGVDEFLDSATLRSCIVVAIDNGGGKRMNEYNPYDNERFGKGEGSLYADFIVKTLKPFIDKRYKTLKDKEHTFITGSSMGGLISLYAVLKYPKVFGAAGIFSPAFWISGKGIFDDIRKKGNKVNSRLYFYGGKQEGETMVPDMMKAFDLMSSVSKSKMELVIRDDGKHNEQAWRKEFRGGYVFMLGL